MANRAHEVEFFVIEAVASLARETKRPDQAFRNQQRVTGIGRKAARLGRPRLLKIDLPERFQDDPVA